MQTLYLILGGNRRKQVAAKLGVSLQTVDLYKNALFNKVRVRNAACLIRYAVQSGWMSVDQIMVQGITCARTRAGGKCARSEEHTSELQSLMRISYAVFCLKNKKNKLTCT